MRAPDEPVLTGELLDEVIEKLGLEDRPTLDLAGLNTLYVAFRTGVPADNIQKRIWFASDQSTPLTGGDPIVFFENWLAHGTGGTCFPINGALCTLAQSLGFDARRIAGRMVLEEYPGTNHGSVVTKLDGIDYLVDAQIPATAALPFDTKHPSATQDVLYDVTVELVEIRASTYRFPRRSSATHASRSARSQKPILSILHFSSTPMSARGKCRRSTTLSICARTVFGPSSRCFRAQRLR